jgi:hypothetical protein
VTTVAVGYRARCTAFLCKNLGHLLMSPAALFLRIRRILSGRQIGGSMGKTSGQRDDLPHKGNLPKRQDRSSSNTREKECYWRRAEGDGPAKTRRTGRPPWSTRASPGRKSSGLDHRGPSQYCSTAAPTALVTFCRYSGARSRVSSSRFAMTPASSSAAGIWAVRNTTSSSKR